MVDVWDVYGQLAELDSSTLTPAQRGLIAVCDLRQEVNAGGFDNYFRAWGGNTTEAALAALPSFLGQAWADLLRSAMALLGPAYPTDPDERGDLLDQLDIDHRLHELDELFYNLEGETDANARLNAHIGANPL